LTGPLGFAAIAEAYENGSRLSNESKALQFNFMNVYSLSFLINKLKLFFEGNLKKRVSFFNTCLIF
jgi:hypothetical protein